MRFIVPYFFVFELGSFFKKKFHVKHFFILELSSFFKKTIAIEKKDEFSIEMSSITNTNGNL